MAKARKVFWIVTEGNDPNKCTNGEFGVEIDGVPYIYYKWAEAEPSDDIKYRRIHKREFGEVICRPEEQD